MKYDDVIEAQTAAVVKMAEEKHGHIMEADFLEDVLQTALKALIEDEVEFKMVHTGEPWRIIDEDEVEKEPEKKRYELSKMWKVWVTAEPWYKRVVFELFCTRDEAKSYVEYLHKTTAATVIAITPADQQGFFEGEGLDDK